MAVYIWHPSIEVMNKYETLEDYWESLAYEIYTHEGSQWAKPMVESDTPIWRN